LLPMLAIREVQAGRLQGAAAHLHAGLQIAVRIGSRGELINGLDYCGYLCAATGRHAEALTVWAALGTILTILRPREFGERPAEAHRQESLRVARQALGPTRARAAEERGAAMNLDTAAEYALLLTAPGPPPSAASAGAMKLSAGERELVTLVAQGRADAQIAAQLYISVRTVRTHLGVKFVAGGAATGRVVFDCSLTVPVTGSSHQRCSRAEPGPARLGTSRRSLRRGSASWARFRFAGMAPLLTVWLAG
jgi:hypothetical protein